MEDKNKNDKPIGLEIDGNKNVSSETEVISTEDLPLEEEREHYSFPWFSIIVAGVIVLLIIVCLIIIFIFGGPAS